MPTLPGRMGNGPWLMPTPPNKYPPMEFKLYLLPVAPLLRGNLHNLLGNNDSDNLSKYADVLILADDL